MANDLWVARLTPLGGAGHPFDRLEVQFSKPIQAETFTAADISMEILNGGSLTPAEPTRLADDRYEVSFAGLTGLNTYQLSIGPGILDADGVPMNQDRDATPGEATDAYSAVLASAGITVQAGDSYDGKALVVYGNTATVSGPHNFDSLEILGGATVNQSEATLSVYGGVTVGQSSTLRLAGGTNLTVAGTLAVSGNSTLVCQGKNTESQVDGRWAGVGVTIHANHLTVDAGSTISADGQGYSKGKGPGGTWDAYSGGSYGGRGGGGNAGALYGSATAPTDLGSAGGAEGNSNTFGGGAIRLAVSGTLTLNGEITADGSHSRGWWSHAIGGGSGGSIYVAAGTLAGSGKFTADGNLNGGGGRVAVYYRDGSAFTGFTTTTAAGGDTSARAGTVGFFQVDDLDHHRTDPQRRLFVFKGFEFPAEEDQLQLGEIAVGAPGAAGATLVLARGSTVVAGSISVAENSTIVCPSKNTESQVDGRWAGVGVTIHANHLTVDAGSTISADGRGTARARARAGPGTLTAAAVTAAAAGVATRAPSTARPPLRRTWARRGAPKATATPLAAAPYVLP